jgi:glutathione S-transferase
MSAQTHDPMVTDLPILYSFRRCPFAMRARMALAISGQAYEHREVVLGDKPAELLIASPKATVPVLVLSGDDVIDESLDIMLWALANNDPEHWLSGDDRTLIQANDGPFKRALDRYKYPHRHDVDDPTPFRREGMAFIKHLEGLLSTERYLTGPSRALSDIAIFPFVRQFAATDRSWFDHQPLPYVQIWLDDLITSALFNGVMRHWPQWKASA